MSETLNLAKELMSKQSITPNDDGCQDMIAHLLENAGFEITGLPFEDVHNIWLTHGSGGPLLCLVGHTDVVPPGNEEDWQSPPFIPTIKDGYLYGRGAADMKGSVAAMVMAAKNVVTKHPQHKGTLALLITSDEEGIAQHGIKRAAQYLCQEQNTQIDYALICEPSSQDILGDTIKYGRRGSITAKIKILGHQGHVAYPQNAVNPIHQAFAAFHDLSNEVWDEGNDDFPPTSLQFSNIDSGTGADNVIPGSLTATFNLRFSPLLTPEVIKSRTDAILKAKGLNYQIDWRLSGLPFITDKDSPFLKAVVSTLQANGVEPVVSTSGGTSDGRFIAPYGADVVELGPVNATIHQVDECIKVDDLDKLTLLYEEIICKLLL